MVRSPYGAIISIRPTSRSRWNSFRVEPMTHILVTGATGGQGSATARACLKRGMRVRALVRDAEKPVARDLAALGAELVVGDYANPASIARAVEGVNALFSLQLDNAPVTHVETLLNAALAAGVEHVVQSTVSATGLHESFPGWTDPSIWPDYWDGRHAYWELKAAEERLVRAAGFQRWTIVRPPMIVDNAIAFARVLFPRLASHGEILTAVPEGVKVPYISYASIGEAAATAIANPDRFAGAILEIADDELTDEAMADALAAASGKPVKVVRASPERATELGLHPRIVTQHVWLGDIGYPARAAAARRYGLTPLPIAEWAKRNAARIEVG
ncbi:SDR family NAD(P)-dependent oxidoreductase [Sphingomonas montanisoli]|uniref:SDR family NAD(P)-dependent oxidoreductase n=2 Tax=Sphingomonas montanisoli TaxID=2606412 RepID=A0A5D9C7Z7_9SPHN|nr:SDR family NAD(P)-dependent oxidoreductase [Sphingomonas montanisoli]